MTTTTIEPEALEDETVIVLPTSEEFVPCTQCGHKSCMHFYYKDDLMSFCKHHGEANFEKLTELDAPLLANYSNTL